MESRFHGIREGSIACMFCGETPQTKPELVFLTDKIHTFCVQCAQDAVAVVENEPRLQSSQRLGVFKWT